MTDDEQRRWRDYHTTLEADASHATEAGGTPAQRRTRYPMHDTPDTIADDRAEGQH